MPAAVARPTKRRAPERILTQLAGTGVSPPDGARRCVRHDADGVLSRRPQAGRLRGRHSAGRRATAHRSAVPLSHRGWIGPTWRRARVYRIDDVELASRLSFFLWSSIPDDALIELAAAGKLHEPKILEQQVRRMLADSRSQALVANFAGQWLHLRELRSAEPADREFDENLRQAFPPGNRSCCSAMSCSRIAASSSCSTRTTRIVNERLARHYGIQGVRGSYMRRVSLPKDSPRRGLLGQGSILTVTSVGDRTSPVIRGAWVMENLMGAPVPRPPPGVETDLKAHADESMPTTLRARLERHRAEPSCAACHQIMDPIGFSLENFDLTGRWRERDGDIPVDTSGMLVDGTQLHGVQDLRRALLARSDSFVTSATEKMLMYALGRRIEAIDQPAIRQIVRDSRAQNYRFSSLVLGIVNSAPFQLRSQPKAPADSRAVQR